MGKKPVDKYKEELRQDLLKEWSIHREFEHMVLFKVASERAINKVVEIIERYPYVLISLARGNLSNEVKTQRCKRLKEIIKESDFTFVPFKGSWTNENGEKEAEDAIMILPVRTRFNNPTEIPRSDDELFEFALELIQFDKNQQDENGNFIGNLALVESFGQDNFLFKGRNQNPTYYNRVGKKEKEFDDLGLDKKCEKYFIRLITPTWREFTYKECYIPATPSALSERVHRHALREKITPFSCF